MNSNPYLERVLVQDVDFNSVRREKVCRVDRLTLIVCLLGLVAGGACLTSGVLSGWTSLYLGGALGFVACAVSSTIWLCPNPIDKLGAGDVLSLAQMCEVDLWLAAAVRTWQQSGAEVTLGDLKVIRSIFGGPLGPEYRLANAKLSKALASGA